jgi:MoxR-like ATPase
VPPPAVPPCPDVAPEPVDVDGLRRRLDEAGYLADAGLSTAMALAVALGLPLLLEGEPGVGKTEAAKALARAQGSSLIRLQCYEGLAASEALYEWNYQRQLLAIRAAESRHERLADDDLFTEEFLQERPILRAVRAATPVPPVLLIDEIDRADDEFEALLLEFLGEASVTVPEIGTFHATRRPTVVLTSNRSRELHDALRRRCLYHWIGFPEPERVAAILRRRVPHAADALVASVSAFVGRVRGLDLEKPPGMAETIDWLSALAALGVAALAPAEPGWPDLGLTLGALAKTPDDLDSVRDALAEAIGGRCGPAAGAPGR